MKHITNEEFNTAFQSKLNTKIMKAASKKYRSVLGDEVEVCQLEGLWLALRKWESERGMQFTTYLFDCVKRKCYAEATKIRRKNEKEHNLPSFHLPEQSYHDSYLINDMVLSLNERDAKLLSDRFVSNKTLLEIGNENNVSFQAIDQRLGTLTKKMRRILTE